MEKEKKEDAIKKLEQELKEEKKAEITRCVCFQWVGSLLTLPRRKGITAERKKAALERQQFEEMKAKVIDISSCIGIRLALHSVR